MIFVPSKAKESGSDAPESAEIDDRTRFFPGYVFDISQTEEIGSSANPDETALMPEINDEPEPESAYIN
jgi:hypothetical protein